MADNKTEIVISAVDKTRAGVDSALGGLQKLLGSATSLSGALAGLGAAFSLQQFASGVKNVIDSADQLSKLSQKVGVTVESLSALQYAGQLSDVSIEQLSTGLKKLSVNMSDTVKGTGEAKDAFAALGIDVKNSNGSLKSSEQVLLEVANKFSGLNDGAGKTALAIKIFGKAGSDLIPLLNGGSEGLAKMRDEAKSLGAIIGDDLGKKSEEFNDNLTRLNAGLNSTKKTLANELLPWLTNFTTALVEGRKAMGSFSQGITFLSTQAVENPVAGLEKAQKRLQDLQALRLERGLQENAQIKASIETEEKRIQVLQRLATERGAFEGIIPPFAVTPKKDAPNIVDTSAAQKLSDGQRLIAQLQDELEATQKLSRVDELRAEFARGKYHFVTAAEKERIFALAAEKDKNRALESDGAKLVEQLKDRLASEQKLSEVEKLNIDLAKQKYANITSGERESALAIAAKIDAQNKQRELQGLIDQTELGKLEIQRKQIDLATESLSAGKISVEQFNQIRDVVEKTESPFKSLQVTIERFGESSANAIVDFARQGKLSFSNLVDSILSDLLRIQVQSTITAPLTRAFSGFLGGFFGGSSSGVGATFSEPAVSSIAFAANGGVIDEYGHMPLHRYATGGIASRPQLAIFGEGRMPEAYVPLPDGRSIPVTMAGKISGGGSNVVVNVINSTGAQTRTSERNEGGRRVVDVFIEQIKGSIAGDIQSGNGAVPAAMSHAFGLNRVAGAF